MTSNRIQKLLFSDYSDFEDVVLVESPFAETNRDGEGIRQIQLGLTPSKLILAQYKVWPLLDSESGVERRGQDPDIDNFELVSAYPVECVNLSVFRHRRRQTIKVRFCNGRLGYYELGGWQERKMLWSVWCERIKFLSPYETATSVSETSVATSSSGSSSLYIVRSSLHISQRGEPTLWCHFASSETAPPGSWSDPHLYLGPSYFEKGVNYMSLPEIGKSNRNNINKPSNSKGNSTKQQPLALSAQHELMAQEAVILWESQRQLVRKIHRRYGFNPFPGLMAGMGLWHLTRPQAFTLQSKKHASCVHLAQTDCEPSIPVAQLTRTVSLESLVVPALCPDKLLQLDPFKPVSMKGSMESETAEGDVKGGEGDPGAVVPAIYSVSWQGPGRKNGLKCAAKRFTSFDMAHQLTMIDKHLFLQTDTMEMGRMRQDMSCRRAPYLTALLLFSHRISCLVATQVISGCHVRERAVLVVRFVGVAYKCHRLHSLQSAASVLAGLHSPAVYRLHLTWAYVRRHHASKYRRFEDMSRRYLDPRLPLYLKTFDDMAKTPPFIPSTALLSSVLLQRLPEVPSVTSIKFSSDCSLPCQEDTVTNIPSRRRLLSAFNLHPPHSQRSQSSICESETHLHTVPQETLQDHLDQFFAPVSDPCSHPAQRVLQDLEYFLETSQAAASRYAMPTNHRVRTFLLHSNYDPLHSLFNLSKQLEP